MHPNVQTYTYIHKTTTGQTYPVEIGYSPVDTTSIPTDRPNTLAACRQGCPQYAKNGGCPPFSPDFTTLREGYPYGVIVFARIYTRDNPLPDDGFKTHWGCVEKLLSHIMHQIGDTGKEHLGGVVLGTGECIGCHSCNFKSGSAICTHPARRTFSMESTGILVGDLVEQQLGFQLQWWNHQEPDRLPEYMTKVILLLFQAPIPLTHMETIFPPND